MIRTQYESIIDFKKELQNKDISQIMDFFSHINNNLDNLAYDSNNFIDQTKILKIKEFIKNLTRLIEVILNKRENPLSEGELKYFKKLIMNYVEKNVFETILNNDKNKNNIY